jgi:transposase
MTRTSLDDAQWMSLMLVMQQIPLVWKRDEATLRRFVEAALWICWTGAPWRDLSEALGLWSSVYHRWRRWCLRGWWELVFEALRPALPADGLLLLDSTTCKVHRAASGAAGSTAAAEALGRSRGGLCSKLHACADGAGQVLRLIASLGHHADLRYAGALASGIPACDAALDRGYVSAPPPHSLRSRGMRHPHSAQAGHGRSACLGSQALRPAPPRRKPVLQPQRLGAHRPPA